MSGGISGGLAAGGSPLAGKGWEMTTVRAATASALTQGVAVVTGLQKSFDWRSVAASAVGAGLGAAVSAALGDANDGQGAFSDLGALGDLVRGTMAGIASGTAAAVMRGGRVSIQQVASDAFGNALGGVFVDIAQRASAQEDILMQANQDSEIEEQNAVVDALEIPTKSGEEWAEDIARRKLINDPLSLIASVNDSAGVIRRALALQGHMLAPADSHKLADLQGSGPWSDVDYRNGSDVQSDQAMLWAMNVFRNRSSSGVQVASNGSGAELFDAVNFSVRLLEPGEGDEVPNLGLRLGKTVVGMAEFIDAGIYNSGVRLFAGAASVPYVFDSVNTAVGVQNAVSEKLSYEPRSDAAKDIQQYMQSIGQRVQDKLLSPARSHLEEKIGDGATTVLFGTAQAGAEIISLLLGVRGVQGFFKDAVFVPKSTAGKLYSGIPIDASGRWIPTVTSEMSKAFEGRAYYHPMTNKLTPPLAGEKMTVDHIYPSAKIVQLPGFRNLTPEQMKSILQDKNGKLANLQPLPQVFNASKRSSTNWTSFKGQSLHPDYATTLAAQQREIEIKIRSQIRIYQQQNLMKGK